NRTGLQSSDHVSALSPDSGNVPRARRRSGKGILGMPALRPQISVFSLEDQETGSGKDRSRIRDLGDPEPTPVPYLWFMLSKLPRSFYSLSALDVASDLLGKVLVRRLNRRNLSGKIVETEAYVGPHDLACHASKGHTARTAVMFGEPGHAYV